MIQQIGLFGRHHHRRRRRRVVVPCVVSLKCAPFSLRACDTQPARHTTNTADTASTELTFNLSTNPQSAGKYNLTSNTTQCTHTYTPTQGRDWCRFGSGINSDFYALYWDDFVLFFLFSPLVSLFTPENTTFGGISSFRLTKDLGPVTSRKERPSVEVELFSHTHEEGFLHFSRPSANHC